jgi:EF-hand domain pair
LRGTSASISGIIATAGLLCTAVPFASAQPTPTSTAEIWDANRDGVYTCDEWKGYLGRVFDRADHNHDGILTPAEFESVRRTASALADADFGYFDENQDGKITRSEFVEKRSEFILQYDKNGDCRVTPDELKDTGTSQKPPGAKGKKF